MENYEGLSLKDLKALYEEKVKHYNDNTTDENLYNDCISLSNLIQKKENQIQFGGNENVTKVRCEICGSIMDDDPIIKDKHSKETHNTWVNFIKIKPKENKNNKVYQATSPYHEKNTNDEIIEIKSNTSEVIESDPKHEVSLDDDKIKVVELTLVEKLKEKQAEEDQFFREMVNELKKKDYEEKFQKEKTPKIQKEKRNLFRKKPKEEKQENEPENKKPRINLNFPRRRYKKPSFGLFGQFPIIEVLLGGGPMILMKNADRSLEILHAKKIGGQFFETDIGVFELEGEYEYRFNSISSFYVYSVHNGKPIKIQAIERIQRLYRDKKAATIVGELAKIKLAVTGKETDPLLAMAKVFKDTAAAITDETKKFLVEYITYNKSDIKLYIQNRRKVKKPERDQTKPIKTVIPFLILMGMAIGVVIFMRFFNPLKYFDIPILLGGLL